MVTQWNIFSHHSLLYMNGSIYLKKKKKLEFYVYHSKYHRLAFHWLIMTAMILGVEVVLDHVNGLFVENMGWVCYIEIRNILGHMWGSFWKKGFVTSRRPPMACAWALVWASFWDIRSTCPHAYGRCCNTFGCLIDKR